MKLDTFLCKIYFDPENTASFSSVNKLYKLAKSKFPDVTIDYIKDWLSAQDVYTLHKPVKKKLKRNRIVVQGIDHQWQVDLADLNSLSKSNNGYHYILTCIDILSKYAWAFPLKSKTGSDIIKIFDKIFKDSRVPIKLQSDGGREFNNFTFKKYLKEKGVQYFTTENETKCSIVEHFNRTLKSKMWKYFTHKNTQNYLSVLPKLVKSYNNSVHSSIKMKPKDVTVYNQHIALNALYDGNNKTSQSLPKFTVGDDVRISKMKHLFAKGYESNWSYEIFTIIKVISRDPPVYKIKDYDGKEIDGVFYSEELQKVSKSKESYWQIEKVLKTQRKNGKTKYFVNWLHHPKSMSSWVSDIKSI